VTQDDDLELPLTTTAGEHADEAAQKPVQQTHQHDAQSEPLRRRSRARPSRSNRISLPQRIPYRITLIDDVECEFRALLRHRRVRVHQIRAIDWDEDDIYLVHDRGKIHIQADRAFEDLLVRLLELNPAIKTDKGVRALLKRPSDAANRAQ